VDQRKLFPHGVWKKGSVRHHGFQYYKGHPWLDATGYRHDFGKRAEPRFRTAVMQEVIKDPQFCRNLRGLGRWDVVGEKNTPWWKDKIVLVLYHLPIKLGNGNTHTHSYTCFFSNMGFSLTWLVRWRGLISPSSNRCQAVKQRPSICDMQIQPWDLPSGKITIFEYREIWLMFHSKLLVYPRLQSWATVRIRPKRLGFINALHETVIISDMHPSMRIIYVPQQHLFYDSLSGYTCFYFFFKWWELKKMVFCIPGWTFSGRWLSHPSEKYEFVNGKDGIPYINTYQ